MTHRLPDECAKVTLRLRAEDMDLLRLLFPGQVNEVVRSLLAQYCTHIRAKGMAARVDGQAGVPSDV